MFLGIPGRYFITVFFNFMSWNVNSIAKDDFQRVRLIEAHNSIFNYDLISICETSLNDSIKLPDIRHNDYTFVHSKNPTNTRHGGVGLFFKNSLPIKIRNDLSFDESIVIQRYIEVLPLVIPLLSSRYSCQILQIYIPKSKKKIRTLPFFTGDINGHSQFWWPDGDTTSEGREIENLISSLNLSQLISEPTNFEPNKNPSCIDLVITDRPNLVLDCGTRASLDSFCHHEITYCKVNFNIPPPPPFERKIWHYDRANIPLLKRSMFNFPWLQHLDINQDPNWQVKTFTEFF